MKKVRITNYSPYNVLSVFSLIREYTNYEFNCCKMITDEMNPQYYEKFKDKGYPKPLEKCDITVIGDANEFIDKMKDLGRDCVILDDNDPTFEDINNVYKQ
jgi:Fe-S-cluster containining protein